jgi:shikimate dehydrogenase
VTISGATRIAAVLGDPVVHSRSPAMLNAAFAAANIDAVMVPMHVAPRDLPAALAGLRAMRALGASVTMPHKLATHAACDALSPEAAAIGAVNCVRVDGDRLIGHNTDAGGFRDSLLARGFSPTLATRTIILGAGGAARAVAYGLADTQTTVVARDPAKVAWTTAQPWSAIAALFATADLVVDTTPLGMDAAAPHDLPLDALAPRAWVASLIYHHRTQLLAHAEARRHEIVDGRGMLVHQAARAFAIWTGAPATEVIAVMTAALARSLHA